jgi:tetratricopeptide (TPR) repeat protein
LEAAREAAAELTAVVKEGGSSEPFLLLRVAADIALAEGDATSALEALEEMSRYGVPLGGLKDIERRESLARAFRMTGRLEDSASVLEELLRIYGSHALARYQLGQIYEQMGRARDAEREYTVFLDAWSKGDEGLPQVVDARERLDALRGQR